jgi:hypothetical protein
MLGRAPIRTGVPQQCAAERAICQASTCRRISTVRTRVSNRSGLGGMAISTRKS